MVFACGNTNVRSPIFRSKKSLNHFIDKFGKVKKIHTGFNGPATGEKFIEFKEEFNKTIQELTTSQETGENSEAI